MIRNGFIRDSEGDWHSLMGICMISIFVLGTRPENNSFNVGIKAHFTGEGEDCYTIIADDFEGVSDAQDFLDDIMEG